MKSIDVVITIMHDGNVDSRAYVDGEKLMTLTHLFLVRCPVYQKENYGPNVSSGS